MGHPVAYMDWKLGNIFGTQCMHLCVKSLYIYMYWSVHMYMYIYTNYIQKLKKMPVVCQKLLW